MSTFRLGRAVDAGGAGSRSAQNRVGVLDLGLGFQLAVPGVQGELGKERWEMMNGDSGSPVRS